MGFGRWPSWVKGGIIGVLLFIIIYVLLIILSVIVGRENFIVLWLGQSFMFLWNIFDFFAVLACKGFCRGEDALVKLFTTIPSFFVVGALIGWIVGKIRRTF